MHAPSIPTPKPSLFVATQANSFLIFYFLEEKRVTKAATLSLRIFFSHPQAAIYSSRICVQSKVLIPHSGSAEISNPFHPKRSSISITRSLSLSLLRAEIRKKAEETSNLYHRVFASSSHGGGWLCGVLGMYCVLVQSGFENKKLQVCVRGEFFPLTFFSVFFLSSPPSIGTHPTLGEMLSLAAHLPRSLAFFFPALWLDASHRRRRFVLCSHVSDACCT